MENGPGLKMYFLLKMGIFQPAMLVKPRGYVLEVADTHSSPLERHTVICFSFLCLFQGTIGCTPNSVPMVFVVFSRDSSGL